MGFMIVSCFVLIIFIAICLSNESTNRECRASIHDNLIANENIKFIIFSSQNTDYISVSNDEIIYMWNRSKGTINIKNIMATEINYSISERNKMKIVSVVPEYNKKTVLNEIRFTVYRRKGEDFTFNINPNSVTEQKIKKLKLIIDEEVEKNK